MANKECTVCAGEGEVWGKASNGSEVLRPCPSCAGSGEAEDRLRKVMPVPKPDLLK